MTSMRGRKVSQQNKKRYVKVDQSTEIYNIYEFFWVEILRCRVTRVFGYRNISWGKSTCGGWPVGFFKVLYEKWMEGVVRTMYIKDTFISN